MHAHARYALAHPVYNPVTEIVPEHFWRVDRDTSAGLTVNIGTE